MISLKVRPSMRLLCVGVGVLLLTGVVALWRAGDLAGNIGGIGAVAGLFLLVGTLGKLEDEDETPGSARFHELADPSRTLSADDFRIQGGRARAAVGIRTGCTLPPVTHPE
jgi:hypothetical protein